MTVDDLTPAERDAVQMVYLRRWLARTRRPNGSRRKTDSRADVQRFSMSGDPEGWRAPAPPLSGNRNVERCQTTMTAARADAAARRKRSA